MEACEVMTKECAEKFKAAKAERGELKVLLQASIDTTQKISDRLFKTNGQRAIVETIRDNAKALERHIEKEEHNDSKPAPISTISASPNATKFRLGSFEVTTNSAETASAIMRLIYLAIVAGALVWGGKFLTSMNEQLHSRINEVEKAVIED